MLVTKLTAVLKARSGVRPAKPSGFNGSTPCRRSMRIEQREAGGAEGEHAERVAERALLLGLVDPADAVEQAFDRPERRG